MLALLHKIYNMSLNMLGKLINTSHIHYRVLLFLNCYYALIISLKVIILTFVLKNTNLACIFLAIILCTCVFFAFVFYNLNSTSTAVAEKDLSEAYKVRVFPADADDKVAIIIMKLQFKAIIIIKLQFKFYSFYPLRIQYILLIE